MAARSGMALYCVVQSRAVSWPIIAKEIKQLHLSASMANNIAASQDLISGSLSAAAQAQNLCQAVKSDTEVITMETEIVTIREILMVLMKQTLSSGT